MSRTDKWLTTFAIFGITAAGLAAGLLWMVLTRPVDLVETIGRLL
jgi:hypothetical protein